MWPAGCLINAYISNELTSKKKNKKKKEKARI